jgi:hypothetical protein
MEALINKYDKNLISLPMNEKIKKLSLVVFSTLITLILGEMVLQTAYRINNERWLWQEDAFRVDYIAPTDDSRRYALRPDFYDKVQNMPINVWGERITTQPFTEEVGQVVVCLGDSVPFGAGIGNEVTYPTFLAETLSEQGYRYYVINAGVPSYNLKQSFEKLKIEVFSHVKPSDVQVITVQAANDISLLTYYRENWTPDLTWADVRFNITPIPFSNFLAISHYLSQWLSHPKGTMTDYDPGVMLSATRRLLMEEMENLKLENDKVSVILLPINPFYYQLENTDRNASLGRWERYGAPHSGLVNSWDALIRDFNDVLMDVSNQWEHVYYLDVRYLMDQVEREGLYGDYIHLTEAGSRLQAEFVTQFMQENGMLTEGSKDSN